MRIYAIGDVHGQLAMFERALALIAADGGADEPIVFVGDYVDRGPESRAILDRLMAARDNRAPWTMLKGNHDRMFHRFVTEGMVHDARILSGRGWLDPALGGVTTLASYFDIDAFVAERGQSRATLAAYGIDHRHAEDLADLQACALSAVPQAHLDFVAERPTTHRAGGLFFVHAGLRPDVPFGLQDEDDLLWIREPWLTDQRDHGVLVVHGHTARDRPEHCGNRVNLDGGAGYGRPLVPVVFEGLDCWALTEDGRRPLVPASDLARS